MLSGKQLENIGASYVMNLLEPNSPYGAELARRPHFHTVNEHERLIRELGRVERLADALRENNAAFVQAERALMQLKDVRRSLERCAEFARGRYAIVDAAGIAKGDDEGNSEGIAGIDEGIAGIDEAESTSAAVPALSDVELFELKRFLILLEPLADAYGELIPGGLDGVVIRKFTEALDIIDPDGMRALTFRVSDSCSERIANIRAERRKLDLAIRNAAPETKDALITERTLLTAKEDEEEARLRGIMTARLGQYAGALLETAACIAELDFAMAKARLLVKLNGMIPTVEARPCGLNFKGMVNPRTAEALRQRERGFTPIDISLNMGSTVITGANMGGKSVALKTLALNAYLALSGFPVFCTEARLPHFSDIHLICEDMEDSSGGLSSFGGEMVQFDTILRACGETSLSLVLLDEFARGTNPHEGSALVRAAVMYFNADPRTMALITTHFDDVARFASMHYQVAGLRGADKGALSAALSGGGQARVRKLERFMDYGLYPAGAGDAPPRDALTICRALGVSEDFMRMVDVSDEHENRTNQ